eukprot:1154125-Pelagomonas_calceolata.AAC.4
MRVHALCAGPRRPPVVPGSRGELMQRSLHGRQGTMLVEDEQAFELKLANDKGDVLHPPGALASNVGTPATAAMPGARNSFDSAAAAAAAAGLISIGKLLPFHAVLSHVPASRFPGAGAN